ncbi:AEC family transporter [Halothiobacillus sp. DCM-1]|uniref:AEC family transporter n=1 Tax=Halothiobacillus sp. DCM-1 TaxID=3112558 RepID=UPI003244303A
MIGVIAQMAFTIALGLAWRQLPLGGLTADRARPALTTAVYYFFLPALVLSVLWRAPLGIDTGKIALASASGILSSLLLMTLVGRFMRLSRTEFGALLLAASFPNATYLGLPLLSSLYGEAGKPIAIQYDLFAATPILLSLGIYLASRLGTHHETVHPVRSLLKVPPLWAALIGSGLNLSGLAPPPDVAAFLDRLGSAVVPIMLLALGMSLNLATLGSRIHWQKIAPALLIQLLWMPLVVWAVVTGTHMTGMAATATVLLGATPSMILGLVICDRFGLDTGLYATAATASTLIAMATLPLWHQVLGH